MFGSICAQRDLELEIGFGSACVHSLCCARKSVRARARQTAGDIVSGPCISSLELALAARSGTILMSMVTTSWRKKARRSGADAEE